MSQYIGRFAPSPSGPLHRGSIVAAMASYLDARAHQGKWLLRLEDIDHERCDPLHAREILSDLQRLGFEWDGSVITQSTRSQYYQEAFERLRAQAEVYRCYCSRREISEASLSGFSSEPLNAAPIYPGTCRRLKSTSIDRALRAWRIAILPGSICWDEGAWLRKIGQAGPGSSHRFEESVHETVGDFVLARPATRSAPNTVPSKDTYDWTYQLAVVVDDALSGVTHVIRGLDLQESTSRQIYLQRRLGFSTPQYWHCKLVLSDSGQKLSKQNGATRINLGNPLQTLNQALNDLELGGLSPAALKELSLADFWQHATGRWIEQMVGIKS